MPVKVAPSSQRAAGGAADREAEVHVWPGDEEKLDADRVHASLELIKSHGCARCTLTYAGTPWIANDEPYDGTRIQCPYLLREDVELTKEQKAAAQACEIPKLYALVNDGLHDIIPKRTTEMRDEIAHADRDVHHARNISRDATKLREAETRLRELQPRYVKINERAGAEIERVCPVMGPPHNDRSGREVPVKPGETLEAVYAELQPEEPPQETKATEPSEPPPNEPAPEKEG
jgi:hypothetical protein